MRKTAILIMVVITALFTQDYLTLVNRDKFLENPKAIKEIKVLHVFEKEVLAVLNKEQLKEFSSLKVSVLEDYSGKYFIVSSINKKPFELKGDIVVNKPTVKVVKDYPSEDLKNNKFLNAIPLRDKGMKINPPAGVMITSPKKEKYTELDDMIAMINQDSLASYIQQLQDMNTRFFLAPNRKDVAEWIRDKFFEFGCDTAYLDSCFIPAGSYYYGSYEGHWQYNVVGEIPGVINNNEILIIGGHHDSIGDYTLTSAPGADDNATGVATAFEMARVFSAYGYNPRNRIRFVTFAAEEGWMLGSLAYAAKLSEEEQNIKGMINIDMTGYTLCTDVSGAPIYINPYVNGQNLKQIAAAATESYSSLKYVVGNEGDATDSWSFDQYGFPAIWFFEYDFNDYYHSNEETIDKLNLPYFKESVKAAMATGYLFNEEPGTVKKFTVNDTGSGNSLLAKWDKCDDTDFLNYKVYIGDSSGVYYFTQAVTDTVFVFEGLTEGKIYYSGVSIALQSGKEGFISEKNCIPYSVPLTPAGFKAEPLKLSVGLKWNMNKELDLAGYNIYRAADDGEFGFLCSTGKDTTYTDYSAVHGAENKYYITAADSTGNVSTPSEVQSAVPLTFDQGILLVNESIEGSGTIYDPSFAMIEQNFDELSTSFSHEHLRPVYEESVLVSKLGIYSTVIWMDLSVPYSPSLFNDNLAEIKKYLDMGGNLLLIADKFALMTDNIQMYPYDSQPGKFSYDYLGVDSVYFNSMSRFHGAMSQSGLFNDISLDTTKIVPVNGKYYLKTIEALKPIDAWNILYLYDSEYNAGTNQGLLKNKPVGLKNITGTYKTAALNFPLYYAEFDQAKSVLESLLINVFNEPTGIHAEGNINQPNYLYLEQNYPNPFNTETTISFSLKSDIKIKLTVFDISGKEISVIADGKYSKGYHSVKFNAEAFTSGIYFYQLKSEKESTAKKLMLLK